MKMLFDFLYWYVCINDTFMPKGLKEQTYDRKEIL
jgi:hypothetical protein